MALSEELDFLVRSIPQIPAEKRYWLIRTRSGTLYETFRENSFVALEHNVVPLHFFSPFLAKRDRENKKILHGIRKRLKEELERLAAISNEEKYSSRRIGLISSQIFRFVFEVKKGDIVIIPSSDSDLVSFGEIREDYIGNFTTEEQRKMASPDILKKRVQWIKDVRRSSLDPYLYRIFTAHQAINDVGEYAEVIERSLNDFFILDNEAHVIINLEIEKEIPAGDLFGMGSEILRLVDEFAGKNSLGIRSKDLQVTINLNSPGKIDLKSGNITLTLITAIILMLVGGEENSAGYSVKTPGLPGLVKALDDFKTHEQERQMKTEIFKAYKDSLKIKQPEQLIELLKQLSDNKDLPK